MVATELTANVRILLSKLFTSSEPSWFAALPQRGAALARLCEDKDRDAAMFAGATEAQWHERHGAARAELRREAEARSQRRAAGSSGGGDRAPHIMIDDGTNASMDAAAAAVAQVAADRAAAAEAEEVEAGGEGGEGGDAGAAVEEGAAGAPQQPAEAPEPPA